MNTIISLLLAFFMGIIVNISTNFFDKRKRVAYTIFFLLLTASLSMNLPVFMAEEARIIKPSDLADVERMQDFSGTCKNLEHKKLWIYIALAEDEDQVKRKYFFRRADCTENNTWTWSDLVIGPEKLAQRGHFRVGLIAVDLLTDKKLALQANNRDNLPGKNLHEISVYRNKTNK